MSRQHSMRPRPLTVVIVALISIVVGFLVANLTGQYVGVFAAQVVVAALLVAWYATPKKNSAPRKNWTPEE